MAKRKLMNQMNVVPYIDVMLVLLVIFMVTAPMIQLGNVELPTVGNLPSPPSEAAIVIVHADGSLALKSNPAAPEKNVDALTLLRELQALKAKDPNLAVVVAGDRRATYEKIMDTLDRLRNEGYTRISLQTSSTRKSPAGGATAP
ncbi:ExbD/TolR family protein [Tepidiphilus margaritifer]|uniref:ExbD/TolR family protein n=1 Tax=Tepidiphilus margaritifer TaxID=203471 RepID=UPI0004263151|nr:ExbD/TolR family protein [Tepidiphilus margaritifer]